MKKRIVSVALLLTLLLTILPQRSLAAPSVNFTSVNDMLLDLTAAMPFYSEGELYVSSAIFEARSGRTPELGIYFNHDRHSNLALLYRGGEVLVFDLEKGSAYDNGTHQSIESAALVRSERVFFPLDTVADFFDLDYSFTKVTYGNLLRVKTGAAMLSDAEFIAAAANPMRQRYEQYARTEAGGSDDENTETTRPAVTGVTVCSLIRAEEAEQAQNVLSILETYRSRAALVFDPMDMAGFDDVLRRAVGGGHAVAFALDGAASVEEILAALEVGNSALCRAAVSRTRLVYLENAAQDTEEALEEAGYCVVSAQNYSKLRGGVTIARRVLAAAERRSRISVYLGADERVVYDLAAYLAQLRSANCNLAALREGI